MKYWLYLLLLMATPALAQVRLSPCDKQDYELYASRLKALFNPDASQQYIVVDGQNGHKSSNGHDECRHRHAH